MIKRKADRMKGLRRKYYDIFSNFYDKIIALHSKDRSQRLRRYLIEKSGFRPGQYLLDACTGTGSVALEAARFSKGKGVVAGVDFSIGMLSKAVKKASGIGNVFFVLSDVGTLSFKDDTFHVVTCSHAMYELSPQTRQAALSQFRRVLRPGGRFIMMEHTPPSSPVIKFLYQLRILSMGSAGNREFAKDERRELSMFFKDVVLEIVPGGRSKVVYGTKD